VLAQLLSASNIIRDYLNVYLFSMTIDMKPKLMITIASQKKSTKSTSPTAQGSREFSLTPNSRVLVKTNRRLNAGITKEKITKSISCSNRNTFMLTSRH
jgi:hypothetical protein